MRAPSKTGPLRAETGKHKKDDKRPAPPFYHPGLGKHVSPDTEWFRSRPDAPLRPAARARIDPSAAPAIPMTGFFSPDTDDDELVMAPVHTVYLLLATHMERLMALNTPKGNDAFLNMNPDLTVEIDNRQCFGLFLRNIAHATSDVRERVEMFAKIVGTNVRFVDGVLNDGKPMTPLDMVLLRSREIEGVKGIIRVLYSLDHSEITIDVRTVEDVNARAMARMIVKGKGALFF